MISKKKIVLENRINRKFGEERAYPRYCPLKELRAIRINHLIINSVWKNYFLDQEFDMDLA